MSKSITMISIARMVNENQVRMYSGKIGCMCGCKGVYKEEGDGKRILANMRRMLESHNWTSVDMHDGPDGELILYVENDEADRCYCAYVNKERYEELKEITPAFF